MANAVNVTVLGLQDAPHGYAVFGKGTSRTYVPDPHGVLKDVQAA